MRVRVSVIMPAYNAEAYIAQAIDSVLNQTCGDLELVIVDDGSRDRTVEIVRQFRDPRIRLFLNPENKGVSYSRNRAIRESSGEWLAILDADDWWAPDRLERLLRHAMEYDAHMAADDLHFVHDGETAAFTTFLTSRVKVFGRIDRPVWMTPARMIDLDFGFLKPVMKKEIFTRSGIAYEEGLQHAEDFKLMAECLCSGFSMLLVPEPLYFYRRRTGSLSSPDSYAKQHQGNLTHIRICEDLLGRYGSDKAVRKALESRIWKNRVKIAELRVQENMQHRRYFRAIGHMVAEPAVLRPMLRNLKNRMLS